MTVDDAIHPSTPPQNRYAPAFVWLLGFAWLRAVKGCSPHYIAYGLAGSLVLELLWARVLIHQVRRVLSRACVGDRHADVQSIEASYSNQKPTTDPDNTPTHSR